MAVHSYRAEPSHHGAGTVTGVTARTKTGTDGQTHKSDTTGSVEAGSRNTLKAREKGGTAKGSRSSKLHQGITSIGKNR